MTTEPIAADVVSLNLMTIEGQRAFITAHVVGESGIPRRYQEGFALWKNLAPEFPVLRGAAMAWIGQFGSAPPWTESVTKLPERGLAFIGQTGCGKSLLAACIARALIERGVSVKWQNALELFSRIRRSWNKEGEESEGDILEDMTRPQVLFLDDLGKEKPTRWVLERLYTILERRFSDQKIICFTSNDSGAALVEKMRGDGCEDLAEPIISRLSGMCDTIGEFPKTDFRRKQPMAIVEPTKERG
ncbi:MAG: ATP-binding protein [Patescibacteria group bacterium]